MLLLFTHKLKQTFQKDKRENLNLRSYCSPDRRDGDRHGWLRDWPVEVLVGKRHAVRYRLQERRVHRRNRRGSRALDQVSSEHLEKGIIMLFWKRQNYFSRVVGASHNYSLIEIKLKFESTKRYGADDSPTPFSVFQFQLYFYTNEVRNIHGMKTGRVVSCAWRLLWTEDYVADHWMLATGCSWWESMSKAFVQQWTL